MRLFGKPGSIEPSRLCFGTLTLSPLQRNAPPKVAARLMKLAVDLGVNFFDTAELYENYAFFKELFALGVSREDIIISTKCYAYDRKTAEQSVEKALREMGTDYIDIFLLHEQESEHTLRGHKEALEVFHEYKKAGIIRKVGLSTHYVKAVYAGIESPLIEVIHPIINKYSIGIVDGDRDDMLHAINQAHDSGIFIYTMKALGGGHLIDKYEESLRYILAQKCIDSIAMGMQSEDELQANIAAVHDYNFSYPTQKKERRLFIDPYCIGCGQCVRVCQQRAMKLINGKANVNHERCVLCSYCVKACIDFYIKVL